MGTYFPITSFACLREASLPQSSIACVSKDSRSPPLQSYLWFSFCYIIYSFRRCIHRNVRFLAMDPNADQAEVMETLRELHQTQSQLSEAMETLSARVGVALPGSTPASSGVALSTQEASEKKQQPASAPTTTSDAVIRSNLSGGETLQAPAPASPSQRPGLTSRIVLTTYPKQIGINPMPMEWGNFDPLKRGPVVVSRLPNTIRRRNAIGAHGGSYSIYHALAVASNHLNMEHKPDFTNTEPAALIGPFPAWGDKKKIVAMDPFGHLAPWLYKDIMQSQDIDIRPTIAVTKAHMKIPELEQSVQAGRLRPDGKICINETGELNVTKFAVEPVWYLPGVAERFGIEESALRRALFEHTGGSYPELVTRSDQSLPPTDRRLD